jgi:hypothetical protein
VIISYFIIGHGDKDDFETGSANMTDVFTETLRSWQNFYFMTGGAAAALIGLMFVALSLGMHLVSDTTRHDIEIFVTPSVIYFVSVLLLACIMLVPAYTPPALALALVLGGLAGMGRTIQHVIQLFRAARQHQDFDLGDWLAQIILPLFNYVLILIAALCVALDQWSLAFAALWVATILLLLCAIANTWSLVIWIVEQRRD